MHYPTFFPFFLYVIKSDSWGILICQKWVILIDWNCWFRKKNRGWGVVHNLCRPFIAGEINVVRIHFDQLHGGEKKLAGILGKKEWDKVQAHNFGGECEVENLGDKGRRDGEIG